jgi:hypothetical protein
MVLENWKVRMDYVLPAILLSVGLKGMKWTSFIPAHALRMDYVLLAVLFVGAQRW